MVIEKRLEKVDEDESSWIPFRNEACVCVDGS